MFSVFSKSEIPEEYQNETEETFQQAYLDSKGKAFDELTVPELNEYRRILNLIIRNKKSKDAKLTAEDVAYATLADLEQSANTLNEKISLEKGRSLNIQDDAKADSTQTDLMKHADFVYKSVIDLATKVSAVESNVHELAQLSTNHLSQMKGFYKPEEPKAPIFTSANAAKAVGAPATALAGTLAGTAGLVYGAASAVPRFAVQSYRSRQITINDILYLINGNPLKHLQEYFSLSSIGQADALKRSGFTYYDLGLFTELENQNDALQKSDEENVDVDRVCKLFAKAKDGLMQIPGSDNVQGLIDYKNGMLAQSKQYEKYKSETYTTNKTRYEQVRADEKTLAKNSYTGFGTKAVNATKKFFGFGKKPESTGGYTRKRSNMHKTFRVRGRQAKQRARAEK